jgi:hypothetical protein
LVPRISGRNIFASRRYHFCTFKSPNHILQFLIHVSSRLHYNNMPFCHAHFPTCSCHRIKHQSHVAASQPDQTSRSHAQRSQDSCPSGDDIEVSEKVDVASSSCSSSLTVANSSSDISDEVEAEMNDMGMSSLYRVSARDISLKELNVRETVEETDIGTMLLGLRSEVVRPRKKRTTRCRLGVGFDWVVGWVLGRVGKIKSRL